MESTLLANQGEVAGDSTTARKLRGLPSWLTTNDNRGSGGADATASTAGATDATAGAQRTFTETILKDVIQKVWVAGGDPSILMVGPVNTQEIGRAALGKECVRTCEARWSPYH